MSIVGAANVKVDPKASSTGGTDARTLDCYLRATSTGPSLHALDYGEVKKALVKRHGLTEDGYRRTFRICKPEEGERAEMFMVHMKKYLKRWVVSFDSKQTYEDLRDLFVREQLMDACPRIWL
ncbi:hypothetical protein PoB_007603900 [Plakobranchus ocellatus]|uniref:SCAN box domain-containing protein n=1 Tax=Plakobranchus ocellatus TaxID=259542 RepID=A0AAV4DZQ6_9GAST|nr:hypothetical protein PoB_007603900 [Plakobranchus ocellatus]